MKEIWKELDDLPNYEISTIGRLRNKNTLRILKTRISKLGYEQITITYGGEKYFRTIHRLVAKAFLINPYNKSEVNHIDENKLNNSVSNLEWVTRKENLNHGTWKLKKRQSRDKAIYAYKDGEVLEFPSTKICAQTLGLIPTNVTQAIRVKNKNGSSKTLKGYTFKYKE